MSSDLDVASDPPGPATPPTILVVEDEPLLLEALIGELDDLGFNVVSANSGSEAMAVLSERHGAFDLLVTDIQLGGHVDGWDVAEAARRGRPDIVVIYVTGYDFKVPRQVSGSVLIPKPYRPSSIVMAARKLGIVNG